MRRTNLVTMISLGLTLLFLGGCADRESLTGQDIQTHPAAWLQESSPDFHGARVEAEQGTGFCESCHGGTELRGADDIPGCFESACHDGPGGHPFDWLNPTKPEFHGNGLAAEGPDHCAKCHGEEFRGGWTEVSCFTCHDGPGGHPAGWLDPSGNSFHGLEIARTGPSPCQLCHGSDYLGGIAEVSCFLCHDGPSGHPVGWLEPGSGTFHGDEVNLNGDGDCQRCHGADLSGGVAGISCSTCHVYPF